MWYTFELSEKFVLKIFHLKKMFEISPTVKIYLHNSFIYINACKDGNSLNYKYYYILKL